MKKLTITEIFNYPEIFKDVNGYYPCFCVKQMALKDIEAFYKNNKALPNGNDGGCTKVRDIIFDWEVSQGTKQVGQNVTPNMKDIFDSLEAII